MEKKDSGRAVPGRGKAPGPRVRDWECGCVGVTALGPAAVGKGLSARMGVRGWEGLRVTRGGNW